MVIAPLVATRSTPPVHSAETSLHPGGTVSVMTKSPAITLSSKSESMLFWSVVVSTVVGLSDVLPDTLIVKAPKNPSSVVFLMVSFANFSLTNSQVIDSVGSMVMTPPVATRSTPPVHSAETCLHPGGSVSEML